MKTRKNGRFTVYTVEQFDPDVVLLLEWADSTPSLSYLYVYDIIFVSDVKWKDDESDWP